MPSRHLKATSHRRLLLSVLLLCTGCGGADTATVSGDVTYEGVPVADGMVTLLPADGKGPAAGGRITDGKFRIINLTPGTKWVKVEAVKAVPFARTSDDMARRAEENRTRGDGAGLIDPADEIPANAEGNNEKIEVKLGPNVVTLNLKKPRPK